LETRAMKRFVPGLAFLVFTLPLAASEWPRFRGPNGDGVTPAANIPVEFTDKDFNWKVPIPGVGHSSPVVWGGQIFLTSGDRATGRRIVLGVDARDGKPLWSREAQAPKYKTHLRNSFASSTPAVDAERVYALWGTPEQVTAVAYTHAGDQAWSA